MGGSYYQELWGGFGTGDPDAAMRLALNVALTDHWLDGLLAMLDPAGRTSGFGGDPMWTIAWAGPARIRIRAEVEPDGFPLAHPRCELGRAEFLELLERAVTAYAARGPGQRALHLVPELRRVLGLLRAEPEALLTRRGYPAAMDQRAHFLTLATPDLDAARGFYVDGLGWTPLLDVPGEIIFFQIGPGLVLGLFDRVKFSEDVAGAVAEPSTTGLTLSHNVDSPAEVDRMVHNAISAGASLVKQPQRADFGGYHGHFADPNGVLWEVCHNPGWSVDAEGTVTLSALE